MDDHSLSVSNSALYCAEFKCHYVVTIAPTKDTNRLKKLFHNSVGRPLDHLMRCTVEKHVNLCPVIKILICNKKFN